LLEAPVWGPSESCFEVNSGGAGYTFCSLAFRKRSRQALAEGTATALYQQALREKELELQHAQQRHALFVKHHQDMVGGIGARSLRVGLWVARRVNWVRNLVRRRRAA
jgi:hypothetical protein